MRGVRVGKRRGVNDEGRGEGGDGDGGEEWLCARLLENK
jgi:hypothetical protein